MYLQTSGWAIAYVYRLKQQSTKSISIKAGLWFVVFNISIFFQSVLQPHLYKQFAQEM
ncbi:hypothetical protein [Nostoc sp. ATCC 53789]|uniref:hypothetical protein n=1 Tax=unclassified Nostoc TaxID=2593658 RepID=UPI00132EAF47|nr:hypothetical protein [Nostoc sp. ATCC 53789]QHG14961.1 hypothetical protein GJB62_02480 [Nostoc sp. ATCC 53789]